jgi:CBS domain-containing protein
MRLRITIVCGDYKEADCTGEVVLVGKPAGVITRGDVVRALDKDPSGK